MILVHSLPKRLDEATPWHFFQELRALVEQGVELSVVSTVRPEYELSGVTFMDAVPLPLRRSPRTLLDAWRLDRRATRGVGGWRALPLGHRLRVASWNARIRDLARQWRPDVIHSHWAVPLGSGGVLAAHALGIPYIMTLRGIEHLINRSCGYGDCLDPTYEGTLRVALEHASLITVTCQDSILRLCELGIKDDSRVVRIDHSVDGRRFSGSRAEAEAFARAHGFSADGRLIACVAVMDHQRKGHADLLRACVGLLAERDARLVLVGDGRLRPNLEALARDLGLAARVIFLGGVRPSEVQHVLRAASLSVLPTWTEAFGNVVFESLLVGTPVVTSRVGSPGEVVAEGNFGQVCEAGDVERLRAAIGQVLDDLPGARTMAARGAVHVRERLSVERRAAGFVAAYERVCRERNAARGGSSTATPA